MQWYERVFFCVLDRLQSPGWITHHIVGSEIHTGLEAKQVGTLWLLLGLWLGPLVLDAVIYDHAPIEPPKNAGEVPACLAADTFAAVARCAMIAFEHVARRAEGCNGLLRCYVRMEALENRHRSGNGNTQCFAPTSELGLAQWRDPTSLGPLAGRTAWHRKPRLHRAGLASLRTPAPPAIDRPEGKTIGKR